jgi:hypothetical protein
VDSGGQAPSRPKRPAKASRSAAKPDLTDALDVISDALALLAAVRDERGSIVDFRYEFINEEGCRLNFRSREEHIGRTLLELFPAHRDSPLLDRYAQVVETGVAFVDEGVEYEDVYGEGRRLARSYYVHVAKWGDGFAVSWRDTTERRRLEAELQSHREDLERRVAARTSELREAAASIARETCLVSCSATPSSWRRSCPMVLNTPR